MAVTYIHTFRVSRIILVLLSVGLMVFLYASYANHGSVQLSTQLSLGDVLYKNNSTSTLQTPNSNVNPSNISVNQKQIGLDTSGDNLNINQRNITGNTVFILILFSYNMYFSNKRIVLMMRLPLILFDM